MPIASDRLYAERRWVSSPRIQSRRLFLNPGHLADDKDKPIELSFTSPQTTGIRAGEWCGFGAEGEMPPDQRPDDGGSLTFDSDPLPERLEILGAPTLELDLCVDRPVAMAAARLGDVAPDGSVLRVTYGLLNFTHRDSHAHPEALEPGYWSRVRLQLNDAAHAFPAGHRLRLSLCMAIADPRLPDRVLTGTSTLDLLIRPPSAADARLAPFEPPEAAPGTAHKKLRQLPMRRIIQMDLATNEMVYTLHSDAGELGGAAMARIEESDLDLGYMLTKRYRILENDHLSGQTELIQQTVMKRADWQVRIECRTRLSSTEDMYQFSCDLEAYENEMPFRTRSWNASVPRQLA